MTEPVVKKEYYSIGDVCDLTGLKPHVLRYWETQFTSLSPKKNKAGNRVYREKDIKLILLMKHLLYEEKYTIEGAGQKLEKLRKGEEVAERVETILEPHFLDELRDDLTTLARILDPESDWTPVEADDENGEEGNDGR